MKRYILTGAPGCGKSAIIRQLELEGFGVVEESATDVIALQQACGIAEPWRYPAFIDCIVKLQVQRQFRACDCPEQMQFHDRSVVCSVALATYLGHPISEMVKLEYERIQKESVFEKRVFFIENLGFIAPTAARTITFQEALQFERTHEETYRRFGFELIRIPPGTVAERFSAIKKATEA